MKKKKRSSKRKNNSKSKKYNRKNRNKRIGIIVSVLLGAVVLLLIGFLVLKALRSRKHSSLNADLYIQMEQEGTFVRDDGFYSSQDIVDGTVEGTILLDHVTAGSRAKKSSWDEKAFLSFDVLGAESEDVLVLEFSAVSALDTPIKTEISAGSFTTAVEVKNTKTMYYIPFYSDGDMQSIAFSFDVEDKEMSPIRFGDICVADYGKECIFSSLKSGEYLAEEYDSKTIQTDENAAPAVSAAANGMYLYAVSEGVLTTYASEGGNLLPVGELDGLGDVFDICPVFEKNLLLVVSKASGLFFVDISNPQEPALLTSYDTLQACTNAFWYNDYVFICERNLGIEVIDCTDLSNPEYVTHIKAANGDIYKDCFVTDGILYAASYKEEKVDCYDITDLGNIKALVEIPLDANAMNLFVRDEKLYVMTVGNSSLSHAKEKKGSPIETRYSMGLGSGLEIYDIGNPAEAKLLSRTKIDGRLTDYSKEVFDMDLYGETAVLSFGRAGMYLYDISNPSSPKRTGLVRLLEKNEADDSSGLVSNEDFMPYPFLKEKDAGIMHSVVNSGKVYGISSDVGIYAVDYEVKDEISKADSSVRLSGKPVIQAPDSTEEYITEVISLDCDIQAMADLGDGFFVLACGSDGLKICNSKMEVLASKNSTYPVKDVRVCGGDIYTAEGIGGIAIYRYKEDGLAIVGRKRDKKNFAVFDSLEISKDGRMALVQAGENRTRIVDCSDPQKPVFVDSPAENNVHHMYHRNICVGLVDGTLLGLAGTDQVNWFYEGESEEELTVSYLEDSAKECLSEEGGLAAFGNNYLTTKEDGYRIYDAKSGERICKVEGKDGRIYGKCVVDGNMLIVSRINDGKISVLDISDPANPKFMLKLDTDYVTDVPCVIGGDIYVPLRHDGILKISAK